MTAKTARKQLSVFLSIAMAASMGQAQSPGGETDLSLGPATTISLGQGTDQAENRAPPSSPQLVPSQTASQPTRIQRSVLETPRISTVPVVSAAETISQPERPGDGASRKSLTTEVPTTVGTKELIRERYPNGKPHVERWVAEDAVGNIVNHGQYFEYDLAGTVISSGKYVLGQREGEWSKQLSHEDAQRLVGEFDKAFQAPFSSRAAFNQGQLDGDWTIADAQGKNLAVWSYVAGARQDKSTHFDPSGEITQSLTYEVNLADGPAHMPADGETGKDTTFSDGMMLRQVDKWHPVVAGKQRVLQAQEWHLVPMPLNVASSDWANSRIEYRSTAGIEPIRHGMSVTFYANGQRESEGTYEHGKRTGTFAWWYPNGQQKTVGEYRNDVEHDEWTWWHENGMKHVSGSFVDGRQISEWSRWSADGTLVKRSEVPSKSQVAGRDQAEAAAQLR